jgi:hypothetical protein
MPPPDCPNSNMLAILIDQFIARRGPFPHHLVGAVAPRARQEVVGG